MERYSILHFHISIPPPPKHYYVDEQDSHLFKAAYPKSVRGMVSEIIDDLSSLDRCSSHDTARNFLILLAIEILRDQNKVSELSDWLLKTGAPTVSTGVFKDVDERDNTSHISFNLLSFVIFHL